MAIRLLLIPMKTVLINCGFIEPAKEESIEAILSEAGRKGKGRLRCVAVTGCLAERYREELASEIPEADVVLGIGSNEKLPEAIRRALSGERVVEFGEKTRRAFKRSRGEKGHFC